MSYDPVRGELGQLTPFIKTMKGWATPEIKLKSKSSRALRVLHPPSCRQASRHPSAKP